MILIFRTSVILLFMAVMLAAFLLWRGVQIDESVVFLPVQRADRTALDIRGGDGFDIIQHERADLGGETIAVTTVGAEAGPLIVSCFGNASDRVEQGADYAAKIAPHGQVMLWDYPGYGDSSGEAGIEAVDAVIADLVPLVRERAGTRPVVYWGHSLGGFVCARMAARDGNPSAVILETTAPGVAAVARAWTPGGLPLRVGFDDALLAYDIPATLAAVDVPVLILGAGRDRVLPVLLSRELADAMPRATYLELPEATHFSAGFDPRAQAAVAALLGGL